MRGLAEHLVLAHRRGRNISPAQCDGMLQTIISQVDRIGKIMEHIRDFAQGADRTAGSAAQVNDAVHAVAELLGAQFRSQRLEIQLDLDPSLPTVNANPYALEDVLLNLLMNARDASLEAREATGQEEIARRIVIRTEATAETPPSIRVQVEDEGAGIDPELLDRVFEPFFTTKGPREGTGLGLAIVHNVVSELGGTVELKSRLGQGTVVTVRLPAGELGPNDQRWLFDDC